MSNSKSSAETNVLVDIAAPGRVADAGNVCHSWNKMHAVSDTQNTNFSNKKSDKSVSIEPKRSSIQLLCSRIHAMLCCDVLTGELNLNAIRVAIPSFPQGYYKSV